MARLLIALVALSGCAYLMAERTDEKPGWLGQWAQHDSDGAGFYSGASVKTASGACKSAAHADDLARANLVGFALRHWVKVLLESYTLPVEAPPPDCEKIELPEADIVERTITSEGKAFSLARLDRDEAADFFAEWVAEQIERGCLKKNPQVSLSRLRQYALDTFEEATADRASGPDVDLPR